MADTSPASRPGRGQPVPGQRPTPACLASHHRDIPQPVGAHHQEHQSHGGHHEPHGHPGQELPIVEETSAGGLIIDAKDGEAYAAIIARRNRAGKLEWCLPKGHVEAGETPAQAATREIAEETGIEGQVLRHLGSIDYWFSGDETRIHKIVHHFLLSATGGTLTAAGDPDEEAEAAEWVPLKELRHRLVYPNERRLVLTAASILEGNA